MADRTFLLVLWALVSVGGILWGRYGIANKKGRADYLLSAGQVIGGIMSLVGLVVFILRWSFHLF